MRECRNVTWTRSSGQHLWSAYIRTVIDVHAPSAARSRSYGVGPASSPIGRGSSATRGWCPAVICCVYVPEPDSVTVTVPSDDAAASCVVTPPSWGFKAEDVCASALRQPLAAGVPPVLWRNHCQDRRDR